jgi:uncharacterized protein
MATAADLVAAGPSHPAGVIRGVDLAGPAGRLEALLNTGSQDAPFSALVCHPHPLFGGNLHNKVVYNVMKVLNEPAWGFALPVLRFNFRGAGTSEGNHDGRAEAGDVGAAVDWLVNEYNRPVVLAGFSFGAAMAVHFACAGDNRIKVLALLGLPVVAGGRNYVYPELRSCNQPKLFLSGDRDQFAAADELARVAETAAQPRHLELIAGADHFFTGRLPDTQARLAGWLKEQLA